MHAPRLPRIGLVPAWRDTARRLVLSGVPPEAVDWGLEETGAALFDADLPVGRGRVMVPKAFGRFAETIVLERSGEGMALAYALLWRLQSEPGLLQRRADRDVARADNIAKSVRRDIHKMHAFLRFREVPAQEDRRRFAAWFEPDHRIEEATAPFFANRFGDMDWEIVTPEVTVRFEDGRLACVAQASPRPEIADDLEELWTTYYSSIFNPARLKPDAMRAEMPMKYWRNLPETRAIPSLIAGARARVATMQNTAPTAPAVDAPGEKGSETMGINVQADLFGDTTLHDVAKSASACTRCPLYSGATQIVFGEGPKDADIMFVGEQPGDREDLAGRPFVGPAGQLFDDVAGQVGIDRSLCYVTNAVKHFKFVQRGKRRIHQKPSSGEVAACNWWLEQELAHVDPRLVVAMGATALHALTGNGAGLLKRRGQVERAKDGRAVLVTVHPSYLLRIPEQERRQQEMTHFAADLRRVHELLKERAA
ncbi:MAG: UdgX family uracil-DNA binding protein [Pseudomonadota bacterium]